MPTPGNFAVAVWIAAAVGPLLGCAARSPAPALPPAAAPSAGSVPVFFGTYTRPRGNAEGIYRATLNLQTGALSAPVLVATTEQPSFLAIAPDGRTLYAANELGQFRDQPAGAVSAFAIEPGTGALRLLDQVSSRGAAACYVSLDRTGRFLLGANYNGGNVASFPIGAGGRLSEAAGFIQHEGGSVNPRRQERPHAHSVLQDPAGQRVYAADLGADKIFIHRLDPATGALAPNQPPWAVTVAGGGPRHMAFHPSGRFAYVNLELTSAVTAFAHDPATGALTEIETLTTLPEPRPERNSTAQILVTPDGRFLYVSNRGHDSIAMYAIDGTTGRLTPLGHQPTLGKTPRNFSIDPTGTFLLAANQGSDSVVVFRIDAGSGRLQPTGHTGTVPTPVCVTFAPQR